MVPGTEGLWRPEVGGPRQVSVNRRVDRRGVWSSMNWGRERDRWVGTVSEVPVNSWYLFPLSLSRLGYKISSWSRFGTVPRSGVDHWTRSGCTTPDRGSRLRDTGIKTTGPETGLRNRTEGHSQWIAPEWNKSDQIEEGRGHYSGVEWGGTSFRILGSS